LHGRALAFATGVKLARPELHVLVPMGDGDALAIGGNHFIHAARRNIDITAIIMNNSIYGMTGGQYSPTTGCGDLATTAPYGHVDRPFDIVALARAAGATFIARTTAYHAREMARILSSAINHRGFSVVEVLSQCPTYYGRKNDLGDAVEMMKWYRDHTEKIKSPAKAPARGTVAADAPDDAFGTVANGRIPIGVLVSRDEPEYCESYARMVRERAKA
jgi:2-oxoglutarate ferredoxin oxidoreductase subunit beta